MRQRRLARCLTPGDYRHNAPRNTGGGGADEPPHQKLERTMPKRYSVSCTIVEIDENGEIVEGGHESDLEFEICADSDFPERDMVDALRKSPLDTSDYCT